MRRALLVPAICAALLALPAAPGAAQSMPASVRVVQCSFAQHQATFRGSMHTVEESARMAMRFTLLERTGAGGFAPLKVPGLGRWRRAKPGVVSFAYRQVVKALPENAVYRMRVDFRWWAGDGSVLEQLQRNSRSCRQFAALPNLRVELLGTRPTRAPGVFRYSVRVTNAGRAAVTAPVRLSVGGDVIDTANLADLLPGETRQIAFRGPGCTGSVTAEADPDKTIVESSEADNLARIACPAPARR
jgi:CARDB